MGLIKLINSIFLGGWNNFIGFKLFLMQSRYERSDTTVLLWNGLDQYLEAPLYSDSPSGKTSHCHYKCCILHLLLILLTMGRL